MVGITAQPIRAGPDPHIKSTHTVRGARMRPPCLSKFQLKLMASNISRMKPRHTA